MTRRFVVWVPLLLVGLTVLGAQAPRVHELVLAPANVHWGYYDAKVAPVLRIASGERVRVETMVAGGLQRLRLAPRTLDRCCLTRVHIGWPACWPMLMA